MTEALEFTGERFTPECVREIRYEHIHRYAFAADLVRGRTVLDAACGEGYGSSLLAAQADSVTGVDISAEAVTHARSRYRGENLSFEVADCCALPFRDGQFDVIVSFETLEHLEPQERLLAEFRRVLADDGFLVISSPDRAVYSDRLGNDNPHHVRELDRPELEQLLGGKFPAVRLLGQRLGLHSLLWTLGEPESAGGVTVHREQGAAVQRLERVGGDAVYLIALCAAEPTCLPRLDSAAWLFDDAEESVYAHYYHEIRKNMQAGTLLQERDREIAELRAGRDADAPSARPWWRRWLRL